MPQLSAHQRDPEEVDLGLTGDPVLCCRQRDVQAAEPFRSKMSRSLSSGFVILASRPESAS